MGFNSPRLFRFVEQSETKRAGLIEGESLWEGRTSHGAVLTLSKSKRGNTPGAPAEIQKASLFATVRTREQDLRRSSPKSRKKSARPFAAANIPRNRRFATEATMI